MYQVRLGILVILTLLVILNQMFVFFAPKRKKVNFATRRRQRHLTNFKMCLFYVRKTKKNPDIFDFFFFQM